jgi:hypothetical protein
MKCPGCGTELTEESRYCNICGGMISGGSVDYSRTPRSAADVYEVDMAEPRGPDSFDEYDQRLADVMWIRFAALLVGLPLVTFIAFAKGFEENRTDLLYLGAFLLAMSVLMIILAIRFYRGLDGGEGEKRWDSPPRFHRRI